MGNVNSAENAKLQYEAGEEFTDYTPLTDAGDNKTFNSGAELWSGRAGYDVSILPNGVVTPGRDPVSVAESGGDDVVDVVALTCYLAGMLTSVAASADFPITRGVGDGYKICSITVNSSGALAEVEGSEGSAFSETRGAAGGPPWIPTDSIEVAQVRLSSTTAAVITASEIKQVPNAHFEKYDDPVWEPDYYNARIEFASALNAIHSDDDGTTTATKKVYASYYEPTFVTDPYAFDFVPPENSHTVNSTQVYGTTVGSKSSSLSAGSFSTFLKDGVTDNVVAFKDEELWFRFYPDRNKSPHILCQGTLGIKRTFPAGNNIQADCTISSRAAAEEKSA